MAQKLSIGQLDRQVIFQRATIADAGGGSGRVATDWANLDTQPPTRWAKVESGTGDKFNEQGQQQPTTTWKVTIRRRGDLTTADRLLYKTKTLYIKAISDDTSRREFIVLDCTEYPA